MSESFDRRALLRIGAGAAGGLILPSMIAGRADAATRSAIVVGSGVSGLKAARDLVSAGYAVTMLEGNTRVGGRTWTRDSSSELGVGVRVDMGASWIHGTQPANPIWNIAVAQGWRTLATNWNDVALYYQSGGQVRLVPGNVENQSWKLYRSVLKSARKAANRRNTDQSLQAAFDAEIRRRGVSGLELQLVRHYLNTEIEHDYAGAATDLSVWWWDNDKYLGGSNEAVVADGYIQLVNLLRGGLNIRTGAVVKRVEHTASGVTVTLAGGERLSASACVVTVPLGVLKAGAGAMAALTFAPILPSNQRGAISRLHMGALNKCYLRYPTKFWGSGQVMNYAAQKTGYWAEWLDFSRMTGQNILLAFNAGQYGIDIEKKSDAQIASEAHGVLRGIYGGSIPNPSGYLVTKWMRDPFSYGSYAHVPPGSNTSDYGLLAQPCGPRLFLAGEHTIRDYPNTVHGAYLSGERAAKQVRSAVE
ncbi:MAG: flavin monoamine oxidase family protein [Thermomicrobiales bacterium]